MLKDNTILYRDNHHLNIPASFLTGRFIKQRSSLLNDN
jgi:hypothetical protein